MLELFKFIDQDEPVPYCAVDLNKVICNYRQLERMASTPSGRSLSLRLATKSIRSPQFIEWILKHCPRFGNRLMAYRVREALFLAQSLPHSDILVAYPSLDRAELQGLCGYLKDHPEIQITLMVCTKSHVELLSQLAKEYGIKVRVCIDVNVTTFGFFGASRSPIKTPEQLEAFIRLLQHHPSLELVGLMGYEAQIAGLPDGIPGQFFKNQVIRFLKKQSIEKIRVQRRQYLATYNKCSKKKLEFFNGGGSGSLDTSAFDETLTELTTGSGLICPRQMLYYSHLFGKLKPAVVFALKVATQIDAHKFQCTSGGFVASGVPQDISKLPLVLYPSDVYFDGAEGCNETVSLIRAPNKLKEGDLIYCIHGKAGEIFSYFSEIIAVYDGKVVDRFRTYAGAGQFFQ